MFNSLLSLEKHGIFHCYMSLTLIEFPLLLLVPPHLPDTHKKKKQTAVCTQESRSGRLSGFVTSNPACDRTTSLQVHAISSRVR